MLSIRIVTLAMLLAAPVAAQLPVPPADSTLAGITDRGRFLVRYDIASWHGGDALVAMQPATGDITVAVARPLPSGRWEVLYGRLAAARDTFFVTWRASQIDADSQFTAARVPVPEPLTGVERQMAVAIQVATADFGSVTRPYNSYVIPASGGDWWVFFMPAQTDPRIYPHGGDVRYRITAAGVIAAKDRLHRSILDRVVPPNAAAMVHTSFDSLPCETDVFLVLRRFPRVPEVVATRNFLYQVAVDGSITWTRAGAPSAAAAPPPPTAPARVPLWTPVVDTVGRVPRVMSPGYTAWRDTTTGWRISLFRRRHGERTLDRPDLTAPPRRSRDQLAHPDRGQFIHLRSATRRFGFANDANHPPPDESVQHREEDAFVEVHRSAGRAPDPYLKRLRPFGTPAQRLQDQQVDTFPDQIHPIFGHRCFPADG